MPTTPAPGSASRTSAAAILRTRDDVPMAEVARSMPDDPWAVTVETWEGPIICCRQRRRVQPARLVPQRAVGQQPGAAGRHRRLRRPTPWRGPRHPAGDAGDARGLGWLRRGGGDATRHRSPRDRRSSPSPPACWRPARSRSIRHLPPQTLAAIHALPMGLAMKVALRATGPDRLGPAAALLGRPAGEAQRRSHHGVPVLALQTRLRAGLGRRPGRLGAGARRRGGGGGLRARRSCARCSADGWTGCSPAGSTFVTRWDADPFVRGAYSFVRPGDADARIALAQPLADGRLLFAGEACHNGMAGTVAGAWISGQDAARVAA